MFFLMFIERLYSKPVITQGASNLTMLVGGTARFGCKFLSDLHPYICWMYFRKDETIYHEPSNNTVKELVVYKDITRVVMVRV